MNPFHLLRPRAARPASDDRASVVATATAPPGAVATIRASRVAWLSTVDADGAPALVPTWFWFDGDAFWLFAKPGQRKVRNIRRLERVTLAVGDPADDFAVQLVEGTAHTLPTTTAAVLPHEMKRAYAEWLARIGLDWDTYAATYRQPIIVRPTRYLPWRGLSRPAPVDPTSRPMARPDAALRLSATVTA
ncbi:MAG: pyridoxamine 5'-phosphate oxidase family protein [Chloroflexota bacterium]